MTTGADSESHPAARRSLDPGSVGLVLVCLVLAANSGSVQSQDQPETDKNNMVQPAPNPNAVRQAQREEHNNDRTVYLDHLLEEAASRPQHLSREDADNGGCTPGTYITELDQCLTHEQLAHFIPVIKANTVVSKSPHKQHRHKRQSPKLLFSLWSGATVPYIFNSSFPTQDQQLVLSAMAEWERVTCIRFRPATADDRDVVIFRDGQRCSTNIGKIGGHQMMTLAQPCRRKRILIHELGHVLGLIHEHQRADRDMYVTVVLHNVKNSSQERYQFSKLTHSPLSDGQVKYSYKSIMHYGKNYFAKSPELTTLMTVDRKYQDVIGRAEVPAVSDAEAVNLMYGCRGTTLNRLPDSTCERLKLNGACEGHNKEAISRLCLTSCHNSNAAYVGGLPPTGPHASSSSRAMSHAYLKPHVTFSGHTSNAIGLSFGARVADSFSSSQGPVTGIGLQRLRPSPSLERPATSIFGNVPRRTHDQQALERRQQLQQQQQEQLRQQQQQIQQQRQQQQQQMQQQRMQQQQQFEQQQRQQQLYHQRLQQQIAPRQLPTGVRSMKWIPPAPKARTHLPGPARTTVGRGGGGGMPFHQASNPAWPRSQPQPPARLHHSKAPEGAGAADFSMAAHNMKALSPEALPESPVRPPSPAQELARAPTFQPRGPNNGRPAHLDTPEQVHFLQTLMAHAQRQQADPPPRLLPPHAGQGLGHYASSSSSHYSHHHQHHQQQHHLQQHHSHHQQFGLVGGAAGGSGYYPSSADSPASSSSSSSSPHQPPPSTLLDLFQSASGQSGSWVLEQAPSPVSHFRPPPPPPPHHPSHSHAPQGWFPNGAEPPGNGAALGSGSSSRVAAGSSGGNGGRDGGGGFQMYTNSNVNLHNSGHDPHPLVPFVQSFFG